MEYVVGRVSEIGLDVFLVVPVLAVSNVSQTTIIFVK